MTASTLPKPLSGPERQRLLWQAASDLMARRITVAEYQRLSRLYEVDSAAAMIALAEQERARQDNRP